MKIYIHLFIIYTLLEIVFTVLHYLLTQKAGFTVFIGALFYAATIFSIYLSYRKAHHQKQKQDLLDAFL